MERAKYEEAGELIEQALEIEPGQRHGARLGGLLAHVPCRARAGPTNAARDAERRAKSSACARSRSIRTTPRRSGSTRTRCSWKKDFDNALHYFDRALRLNPNLAFIWALSAVTYCYIGKPDEALKRMERYRELAPFDPYFCFFENIYAIAYLMRGDYEEAAGLSAAAWSRPIRSSSTATSR